MSENNNVTVSFGGLFGFMTVLLLTLKIVGVIDWAWWQCFLPILLPCVFGLGLLGICGILFLIVIIFEVCYNFIRKL